MLGTALLLQVLAAGIAAGTQVVLQPPPPLASLASPEYNSFLDDVRRNASIPGVSVAVVRLGQDKEPVVQLATSGRKTEDGDGHDLTVDTLFGLASCSKAFLATSVGILMDDFAHGRNVTPLPSTLTRFDWHTKVVDILPKELGWAMQEPDGSGDGWTTRMASIRDVLGHVSGLPRHDYAYTHSDTAANVVSRMKNLRTAYELREKWSYNNQMYMLGSYIVSHYANATFADFVHERIFKPVGMSDTTISPSAAARSGKLSDSWTKDGRRIPFWFTDVNAGNAGAGGVIASAEDMAKWLSIWLNRGIEPLTNVTVFPESVYEEATTAHWMIGGERSKTYGSSLVGYGMGWQRWSYGTVDILEHGGAIPGFSILTAFSPGHNVGISVLCNADEKAAAARVILRKTLDIVLGLSPSPLEIEEPDVQNAVAPAPDAQAPSLDVSRYAGTYTSPGYRPIALCDSTSTTPYCLSVLDTITSLGRPANFKTGLYAAFDSVWATHVRLDHFAGDVWNITFTAIMPDGYGKDKTPFELYETGTSGGWVEFAVDGKGIVEGFSLFVDPPACEERAKKTGGGVKEAADAWFERVY